VGSSEVRDHIVDGVRSTDTQYRYNTLPYAFLLSSLLTVLSFFHFTIARGVFVERWIHPPFPEPGIVVAHETCDQSHPWRPKPGTRR